MKRILIVEGRPHTRALLRMTLGIEDYELHEASNAKDGMDLVWSVNPDVILVGNVSDETHSPDGGLSFCRRVRRVEDGRKPHIVMMSQGGGVNQDAAIDSYLVQPIHPIHLLETVDNLPANAH